MLLKATRENTAKVRNVPGERVQVRSHVVVVVGCYFSRPHVPKDRCTKKGERLHFGKKRKENCTYGTDLRGQNVPSCGLF